MEEIPLFQGAWTEPVYHLNAASAVLHVTVKKKYFLGFHSTVTNPSIMVVSSSSSILIWKVVQDSMQGGNSRDLCNSSYEKPFVLLVLPGEREQHSLKVLSHILSDFQGDRQPPLPSKESPSTFSCVPLQLLLSWWSFRGQVGHRSISTLGRGVQGWKRYSDTLRGLPRTKAGAKSNEVSAPNIGARHYSYCLLFIALGIHCFTILECKCYICLFTMVCKKLNCIWYLHFYGIKSDFIGVCIQNLGFRFRVVWLKSPGVLLKKTPTKQLNLLFFQKNECLCGTRAVQVQLLLFLFWWKTKWQLFRN